MVFGRVTPSLFNEVLEKVDSSNIASGDKATDKWDFHRNTLSFPRLVGQVSKHLLASFAALVFSFVAKRSHFNVVNFNAWDNSARTFKCHRANLRTIIVRDA